MAGVPSTPGQSFVAMAVAMAKATSSHYSRLVFSAAKPDLMLQAAQAFADLIQRRMEDIEQVSEIRPIFPVDAEKAFEKVQIDRKPIEVDEPALAALVTYLVALSDQDLKVESRGNRSCSIPLTKSQQVIVERYRATFDAIAIWGNCELVLAKSSLTIRQRL